MRQALDDIRVLDLADAMGGYCTKLLADLGADVVKIEKPEGDPMRREPPFLRSAPDGGTSLYWWYFNTNKRSVTLNLESADGRDMFLGLVKSADVLVETLPPAASIRLGVDYPTLRKVNSHLILTSITGFGLTGPYRDFRISDIVGQAMGGLMNITGLPHRPPCATGASQAYYMASMDGVVGTLLALCHRDATGQGQMVDVAMQGAVLKTVSASTVGYLVSRKVLKRTGLEYFRGVRDYFPCKDGYAMCSALGGSGADVMLDWMDSEGMAADLREERYAEVLAAMGSRRRMKKGFGKVAYVDPRRLGLYTHEIAHIQDVWAAWLKTHTREELFAGAQKRGVRLMPVYTAEDVAHEPQLIHRGFFTEVEHPELGAAFKCPGPPYRLAKTPCTMRRRPPLAGEHNLEIYQEEMGIPTRRLSWLKQRGVV
ncbi:MAG: CoA transferase [Chloroflexota bacterium]